MWHPSLSNIFQGLVVGQAVSQVLSSEGAFRADSNMHVSQKADEACFFTVSGAAGDSWMEGVLSMMHTHYPGQACGLPFFSEEAAHLLLAAADYLLVPSRFEPCGLVALYGLRYGAVPIATGTGGLKDIVTTEVCHVIHVPGLVIGLGSLCRACRDDLIVLLAACKQSTYQLTSAEASYINATLA